MKTGKRVLGVLLAVVMVICAVPVMNLPKAKAEGTNFQAGDIIEFGEYPQTLVTDEALIGQLNGMEKNWISYGYYYGGYINDYMFYADIAWNNTKYRAVNFNKYRYAQTSNSGGVSYQYDNGYRTNTIYFFKYEPLQWRVLDPSTGYVLSESIIDAQAYHNTRYYVHDAGQAYQDSTKKTYATNWTKSSIRAWLNNSFYNTAFSADEKELINITEVDNSRYSEIYTREGYSDEYSEPPTYDKVFLLNEWDYGGVSVDTYGVKQIFSNDPESSKNIGTDYADCQGLSYEKYVSYYLGQPKWFTKVNYASSNGEVHLFGNFYRDNSPGVSSDTNGLYGVRPTMCVDLEHFEEGKDEPRRNIYSLSISGIAGDEKYGTNNDEALFYTRMCANKLDGYIVEESNQHGFGFSETTSTEVLNKLLLNDFQDTTENDISFFFFSGHSWSINDTPVGVLLGSGCISWSALANLLCYYIKGEIVVFLDCCHAEYFITSGILNNENLTNTEKTRFHVLAACAEDELSKPENKVKGIWFSRIMYGCFSYYVGEGLGFVNGYPEADSSGDGVVTLHELYCYVAPKTVSNDMTVQLFGGDINLYQTVPRQAGSNSFWAVGREFDANIDYYTTAWDSSAYNANLADTLCAFSAAVYKPSDIQNAYNSFGFEFFRLYDYDLEFNPNKCGYSLGYKKSEYNDDIIFLISVRGSSNVSDWTGNLALATFEDGKHMGFSNPANHIYENVQNLISSNHIDGNIKYVITGHSRGAAVANLLAVKLMENGVSASNVYDYNIACPDVACKVSFQPYNNIFNICNRCDPVPLIPGDLADRYVLGDASWGKFGITYWYTRITDGTTAFGYEVISGGMSLNPLNNHSIWFYLDFLNQKLNPSDWSNSHNHQLAEAFIEGCHYLYGWITSIFCPVDVTVVDKDGAPIASVIDGQINYYGNDFGNVIILTEGDKKIIYIAGEKDYNVQLVGTDTGTMMYSIEYYNLLSGESLESKTFSNITLENGKKMYSPVSEALTTNDIELFVVSEAGDQETITYEIEPDGSENEIAHIWNEGVQTKKPDCCNEGEITYTCTLCGGTYTEKIGKDSTNHVNTEERDAVASTCTVKGYSAGVYCNDCKQYISGHEEQPLAAHQTVLQSEVPATCTEAGYTGDQYCTVCQQVITPGTVIDALGHDTPDANGDCPRCHEHIQDVEQPSDTTAPATEPETQPAESGGDSNVNFFLRILQWLIDFFAKLFGR